MCMTAMSQPGYIYFLRVQSGQVLCIKPRWNMMCCPQLLTPLLGARLLVKSFPWYPDIPAVCIWISALAGNIDALTELRRLLPDETIGPLHSAAC